MSSLPFELQASKSESRENEQKEPDTSSGCKHGAGAGIAGLENQKKAEVGSNTCVCIISRRQGLATNMSLEAVVSFGRS